MKVRTWHIQKPLKVHSPFIGIKKGKNSYLPDINEL